MMSAQQMMKVFVTRRIPQEGMKILQKAGMYETFYGLVVCMQYMQILHV